MLGVSRRPADSRRSLRGVGRVRTETFVSDSCQNGNMRVRGKGRWNHRSIYIELGIGQDSVDASSICSSSLRVCVQLLRGHREFQLPELWIPRDGSARSSSRGPRLYSRSCSLLSRLCPDDSKVTSIAALNVMYHRVGAFPILPTSYPAAAYRALQQSMCLFSRYTASSITAGAALRPSGAPAKLSNWVGQTRSISR